MQVESLPSSIFFQMYGLNLGPLSPVFRISLDKLHFCRVGLLSSSISSPSGGIRSYPPSFLLGSIEFALDPFDAPGRFDAVFLDLSNSILVTRSL